jgi:hypothetical protein
VAWRVSPAARLTWLHLRSRRVPAALVALLACGAALWASLRYHWWLGTGSAADEVPLILQGCAAAIIAVTMHSPFGEPERAVGRPLPFLRAGLTLALCGAAVGFLALGAAVAYSPRSGVYLAGGILPVARNVLGMTGIGLVFCLATGALLAWTGPLAFTAISQFALIANYSWPLTWPARPPADGGGWIAAMAVFAVGLVAVTIRGPRIRQSGELCPAGGPQPLPGPRPFFDPVCQQACYLCNAVRAEVRPAGRRVDVAEVRLAVELRERVEERPGGGVRRECDGEVLGQIAALRAFRRQFNGRIAAGRNARGKHPRRVQGERPAAGIRCQRHPHPAPVDRAAHVVDRLGAPGLVRVKRNHHDGVTAGILGDPDAEPPDVHNLIVSPSEPVSEAAD